MNLVKKIRRNERKIVAVGVILLLVGFVFQAFLSQCRQQRSAPRKTVAYFADKGEITNYDLFLARQELETLKMLEADTILRGIITPIFQSRDLQAIMLAGLIFPDRTAAPLAIERVKQMITANPIRISEKQINDVHRSSSIPPEIYWILLKNEAQLAGIKITNDTARSQLEKTIPQLFNGATYSQVVGSITTRQNVSEEDVCKAFGSMVAVLRYAELICSNENVTSAQIANEVSWDDETLNVEFVKFNANILADTVKEPDEKKITQQFNKYNAFFAGDISDQNPYGFGYKLHDRVRLEYIAVKLDEIEEIVAAPTQEEIEEFYQRHREEFIASIPTDPNDPNSPVTERIRSYGEVASVISQNMLKDKIDSKAESILQEARTLTELGLENIDTDPDQITQEQLKKIAGDYKIAADKLSTKHKIKVYTGKTELLNAINILTDENLGTLFVRGYGYNRVALIKVIFAVDGLNVVELGPFDAPTPKLYENIGPAKNILGKTAMIVRVIEIQKAAEPESINQTVASGSIELGEEQQKVSTVKDNVVKDLKNLAAMDITKNKAEEFIKSAEADGWENTIDKFNQLYIDPETTEENQNAFKLQVLNDVQRISNKNLSTLTMKRSNSPAGWWLVNEAQIESVLIDQLYSLIPQDSNSAENLLPIALEFKPDMSYYCLRNLSVQRLNQQQYNIIKAARIYREDFIQSQSLAPVHFNPENILKRMNFKLAKESQAPADVNAPAEDEDES